MHSSMVENKVCGIMNGVVYRGRVEISILLALSMVENEVCIV